MYSGNGLGDLAPSVLFTNKTNAARALTPLVGDQWSLKVTGPANSPVMVLGGMNGVNVPASMGSTDAQGVFTLSGTMTADQVGLWYESWSVGGQNAGAFQFSVSPAAGAADPLTPNGSASMPAAPEVPLGPAYQSADMTGGFSFDSIPSAVWYGAAAIAVLLMFGGSGGRRR